MSTRDRLLDAAICCLADDGWARTTTRRILAAAGAHAPDVNYYFGSKEELMREAAVRVTRRWSQGPLRHMGELVDTDPRTCLTEILERFLANLKQDKRDAVAAVEVFAQAERSEQLRTELRTVYEELRTTVGDGVEELAEGADTRSLATVLIALFDGLAVQSLFDPDNLPSASALVDALAALSTVAAAPGARA
ncbi:MAG: TetR/AcrR family transcriptional regulator [Mycobacterium sp.]